MSTFDVACAVVFIAVAAVTLALRRYLRAVKELHVATPDEHATHYDQVGTFHSEFVDPPFWDNL
jgi:hypothetical protein